MSADAQVNYKSTLNLPKTDFPMKAGLVQKEPERFASWQERDLYGELLKRRADAEPFTLHDGPPFANGDIHLGHLINKTLKDVVCRFRSMQGKRAAYVPGWDCHGLPIEHIIAQKLGPKLRQMEKTQVRKLCHEHAEKFIGIQSEQFQRLGILGDWHNPYATMRPAYEAQTLEVFAKFVEHGLVYKQLKPVHWSIENQTALAEAELEYQDRDDPSVYVEFALANPGASKSRFGLRDPAPVSLMIWTTTPWTLPANRAVAVHADVEYAFVRYDRDGERIVVVATDLLDKVLSVRDGIVNRTVLNTVKGSDLVGLTYRHPLEEGREGRVVAADYVTTDSGTGLVHTAPGHGDDDYQTGRREGIEVYCPVGPDGRFDSTTPNFVTGLKIWEANPVIIDYLKDKGTLFAHQNYHHSYPHDWRSKTPTIFRATEQWFVSLDTPYEANGETATLRERASRAAEGLKFYPEWGRARLRGMLDNRPDWTLSRQRAWGLPIPVFYREDGEPLLTPQTVRAVAKKFEQHGSDCWFTMSPSELLDGTDIDAANLRKETDIFDVWFESGSSWQSVLNARDDLPDAPADLYLEGSDQHRGWFQLSLLASLGATGKPPFTDVLTHGFVVKPDGTKVSKSDKEYVTATQEIDRHGADVLRLWTCSVDYQGDMPASPKALAEFGDKYRKIRNTLRFLLGNVSDFDPAADARNVPAASLDGWMNHRLDVLINDVTTAFDKYQTHRAFRLLHDFCAVDISTIYGNALKDRLYCDRPDSDLRRRAQTVLHRAAVVLTKLLAPMLVYTADEAWEHLGDNEAWNVHLAKLPETVGAPTHDGWPLLMKLRDDALLQLDGLKKDAGLNKATDAEIAYHLTAADRALLEPYALDLADVAAAGWYSVHDAEATSVKLIDRRQDWQECARSRRRTPDVGTVEAHPNLTPRDAAAIG
jgi:isoleucyl-tRNA synthetase